MKVLPEIGDLEFAVMTHLWNVGEADVGETHAAIGLKRGIKPNTVGSALERLFRKDLVKREKQSHAFRYTPALSRDEFSARRILDAGGGLEALSRVGMLSAFVDLVADVDHSLLDHLQSLIAEKRDTREEGRNK